MPRRPGDLGYDLSVAIADLLRCLGRRIRLCSCHVYNRTRLRLFAAHLTVTSWAVNHFLTPSAHGVYKSNGEEKPSCLFRWYQIRVRTFRKTSGPCTKSTSCLLTCDTRTLQVLGSDFVMITFKLRSITTAYLCDNLRNDSRECSPKAPREVGYRASKSHINLWDAILQTSAVAKHAGWKSIFIESRRDIGYSPECH